MIRKIVLAVSVSLIGSVSLFAGKSVVVDLSTQTATAYENDVPVFSGQISTGTAKRPTPTGRFRVLEKDIDHVSSSWPKPNGGAKMHYMLRLTNYGIAMHLGFVPNYPASHGCIRLQNGFAQRMYRWAYVGMPVRVVGHAPARVHRPTKRRTARRVARSSSSKQNKSALALFGGTPKKERVAVQRSSTAKKVNKRMRKTRKKRNVQYKKPTTLEAISSSPKTIKRVQEAQQKRWQQKRKVKVPHTNPLDALKA